jgi:hypothetical protein
MSEPAKIPGNASPNYLIKVSWSWSVRNDREEPFVFLHELDHVVLGIDDEQGTDPEIKWIGRIDDVVHLAVQTGLPRVEVLMQKVSEKIMERVDLKGEMLLDPGSPDLRL